MKSNTVVLNHLLLVALLVLVPMPSSRCSTDPARQLALVQSWTKKLGEELLELANGITRKHEVQESFNNADVIPRNASGILSKIAEDVSNMLQRRTVQTQRIVETAERAAFQQESKHVEVPQPYVPVKDMDWDTSASATPTTSLVSTPAPLPWLHKSELFGTEVNLTISGVHVPTTVYDGEPGIQRAIRWTQELESTFKANFEQDKSTLWQFFAHNLGFMRQFPVAKWKFTEVDVFDARVRPWYLGAATSAKDIVILLDNSGSMQVVEPGELSRKVVTTVLDTLGPDDFVNVLIFNDTTESVIPGLQDKLIPATLSNVRELKESLETLTPKGRARFAQALSKSFEILEDYRRRERGAVCNQAIMLVTDGIPDYEQQVFMQYNWQNSSMPVRIFTFLVGDAEDEAREAKWMACVNKGWHMNLRKGENDQILRYVSVMARPMVLQADHPIHWTHLYADVTDPSMTDFLWSKVIKEQQRKKFLTFCRKHLVYHPKGEEHYLGTVPFREATVGQHEEFVISVSMPVYNTSVNGSKVGELLGVAGIDVAVKHISRLLPRHKLGVNAYVFMVTNNGLIIFHPDLRPTFNNILKPSYNSIHMVELELDDESSSRTIGSAMQEIRNMVVRQMLGNRVLTVKQPYDNMRRVSRLKRRYYVRGVEKTPYCLIFAVPDDYGKVMIHAQDDLVQSLGRASTHFDKGKWNIHPDWIYCGRPGQEAARRLLDRLRQRSINADQCDIGLVAALLYDARVTKWFSEDSKWSRITSKLEKWSVLYSFISTRSGLTRWQAFPDNRVLRRKSNFSSFRGPDEVWYKRAVDYYSYANQSFVYSVPHVDDNAEYSEYNAGAADNSLEGEILVTASSAIFVRGKVPAPIAAVGFQFPHSKLQTFFNTVTQTIRCSSAESCDAQNVLTCPSDDLDCYLLDEHGIVVVDETGEHVGKPFGRVNTPIMEAMVAERIYQRVHVVDFQGMCQRPLSDGSAAPSLHQGLRQIQSIIAWTLAHILALVFQAYAPFLTLWTWSFGAHAQSGFDDYEEYPGTTPDYKVALKRALAGLRVNKTRLQPCDIGIDIYHLMGSLNVRKASHVLPNCERPYAISAVPGSNLLLTVVLGTCPPPSSELRTGAAVDVGDVRIRPEEVLYDTGNGTMVTGSVFKADQLPHRRRPTACYWSHVGERNISECGRGHSTVNINLPLILISSIFSPSIVKRWLLPCKND